MRKEREFEWGFCNGCKPPFDPNFQNECNETLVQNILTNLLEGMATNGVNVVDGDKLTLIFLFNFLIQLIEIQLFITSNFQVSHSV